jgi:hypothetical protein
MFIRLILATLISLSIPFTSLAQEVPYAGPPYSKTPYVISKKIICQDAGTAFKQLSESAKEMPFITGRNANAPILITVMVLMNKEGQTFSILEMFPETGMVCVNAFGIDIKFFNFHIFEDVLRDGKGKPLPSPAIPGNWRSKTFKQRISAK